MAGAAGGTAVLAQHGHHHGGGSTIQHHKLAATAGDCVLKGQECVDHCINVIKAGDVSIADCMRSVEELIAACNALRVLTISNSKNLRVLARAVDAVCQTCEIECRKHERHEACKICGESCLACSKEIRATFA
jgi:Cys-rich four helix bundle protein (predicted Tat secretion target)